LWWRWPVFWPLKLWWGWGSGPRFVMRLPGWRSLWDNDGSGMDSYGQWHGDGTSVAGLRRGLRGSVGLDRGLRSSISVFHGGLRGSVSIFFRRGLRGSIGFFLLRGSVLLRGLRGTVGVQLGGGVPGVPLLCNVRFKGKLVIKFIFGVRGS
jgi:hypothetical protein